LLNFDLNLLKIYAAIDPVSTEPINENTKMILIEDDRDEYLKNKNKEPKSYLLNMISSMINCAEFKYNYETVWNMKIGAFIDSVKRIKKIKNVNRLLNGNYDLKNINQKELDWLGELD
jgi:hypothetical protein